MKKQRVNKIKVSLTSEQFYRDILREIKKEDTKKVQSMEFSLVEKSSHYVKIVLYFSILQNIFKVYLHIRDGVTSMKQNNQSSRSIDYRMSSDTSFKIIKKNISKEIKSRYAGFSQEMKVINFLKILKKENQITDFQKTNEIEDRAGYDVKVLYKDIWIPLDITTNVIQKEKTRLLEQGKSEQVGLLQKSDKIKPKYYKLPKKNTYNSESLRFQIPLLDLRLKEGYDVEEQKFWFFKTLNKFLEKPNAKTFLSEYEHEYTQTYQDLIRDDDMVTSELISDVVSENEIIQKEVVEPIKTVDRKNITGVIKKLTAFINKKKVAHK